MFQIGENYIIRQIISGRDSEFSCKVLEYDEEHGMLKVDHSGIEKVINITSSAFVEAQIDRPRKLVKVNLNLGHKDEEQDLNGEEDPLVFY